MNAPLPARALLAPDRDPTSRVASRRCGAAARRIRLAIGRLRAAKNLLAKARGWLPANDDALLIQLEVHRLFDVEKKLIAIARKLEAEVDRE